MGWSIRFFLANGNFLVQTLLKIPLLNTLLIPIPF